MSLLSLNLRAPKHSPALLLPVPPLAASPPAADLPPPASQPRRGRQAAARRAAPGFRKRDIARVLYVNKRKLGVSLKESGLQNCCLRVQRYPSFHTKLAGSLQHSAKQLLKNSAHLLPGTPNQVLSGIYSSFKYVKECGLTNTSETTSIILQHEIWSRSAELKCRQRLQDNVITQCMAPSLRLQRCQP